MDTRSERPDLRHELKLVSDEASYARVRTALRLDRAGLRTLYPERCVQSVYLDTTYGRALQENLAGLSAREKVRLRWYGPETRAVRAHLERKCRENSLGWKELLELPEPLDVEGVERRGLMRELARRADTRWRMRLATLEPAQWIAYRREYLTSADGRVRVTLDRELAIADQRPLARLSPRARTSSPRVLVVEVKCGPEDLDRAREIVARLPMPLGRCSKYALAAAPESGPIPSLFEVD